MASLLVGKFLSDNAEDADYNQYWYSPYTISKIVEDLSAEFSTGSVAFLSTPSIYFSLDEEFRSRCFVFDFDKKWENDRGTAVAAFCSSLIDIT